MGKSNLPEPPERGTSLTVSGERFDKDVLSMLGNPFAEVTGSFERGDAGADELESILTEVISSADSPDKKFFLLALIHSRFKGYLEHKKLGPDSEYQRIVRETLLGNGLNLDNPLAAFGISSITDVARVIEMVPVYDGVAARLYPSDYAGNNLRFMADYIFDIYGSELCEAYIGKVIDHWLASRGVEIEDSAGFSQKLRNAVSRRAYPGSYEGVEKILVTVLREKKMELHSDIFDTE